VVGLAILRAFVNSERFALIELAVPFFVAGVALRYIGSTRVGWVTRTVMVLAPLLGVSALYLLFTGFEYFRSWSNYYAGAT